MTRPACRRDVRVSGRLPTRYFAHSAEGVDAHFALSSNLVVRWRWRFITAGFYKLTLLTKDRPALFASVAGAISSFGLNILKAERSRTPRAWCWTRSLSPIRIGLERTAGDGSPARRGEESGGRQQQADSLLRGQPKPFLSSRMKLRPRVSFKDDASDGATLIEIVAEDRPELFDLASAISLQAATSN